ncbi:trans-aconitate methyltransferase [Streptomyces sp. TG1A-8]|uniref:trans-aconitate methyltransferase n=1 Tax=Streptomyces sp. TG1A-8 TaxID=3051385 RepID=UPI00265BF3D7|nr:trans-aconitate methyltransferase [Streptomyces sp. TG1A-8]MDO0924847.1 trans-aconitate methyltransferase [Streptomyces sp. TG1A-8]
MTDTGTAGGGLPARTGPPGDEPPGAGPDAGAGARAAVRLPGGGEQGPPAAAGPPRDDRPRVIAGAGPVAGSGARASARLRDGGEPEPPRYAPEWLRLREGADSAARARELLVPLRERIARLPRRAGALVVHDLGCGTGSMGRWLAPRLDGAQHWVLHDRDPRLLRFAAVSAARRAADGSGVTVETRHGEVGLLTPDALTGAHLVTASALLDVLTRGEVESLAAACAGATCPALLTLSVAGRVDLTPAHPLDAEITEAFNAHQRRDGLLGPDAVTVAREAFAAHGATVRVGPSPWRLGSGQSALTAQWLRGWVGAAVEQRSGLRARADRYLRDRLAACGAGALEVVVHHSDLLALPRPAGGAS